MPLLLQFGLWPVAIHMLISALLFTWCRYQQIGHDNAMKDHIKLKTKVSGRILVFLCIIFLFEWVTQQYSCKASHKYSECWDTFCTWLQNNSVLLFHPHSAKTTQYTDGCEKWEWVLTSRQFMSQSEAYMLYISVLSSPCLTICTIFAVRKVLCMPVAWARNLVLALLQQRHFWAWCRNQYTVKDHRQSLRGHPVLETKEGNYCYSHGQTMLIDHEGREYTWDSVVYCKGCSQRGSRPQALAS